MSDVSLEFVHEVGQSARFYKEGEQDYIEISFVGMKDNFHDKVKPKHMEKFRREWDAYCDGRPLEQRKGIPLTECVHKDRADYYIQRNVHTLEELAALSDMSCQGLGRGTINEREAARKKLSSLELDRHEKTMQKFSEVTQKAQENPDMETLKAQVSELKDIVTQLVGAMTAKRGPGRPPKTEAA